MRILPLGVIALPYPEGHKLKVRGRIIESAAKAIRASGVQGISVPFIMKGAGLTHGGSIPTLTIKSNWSLKLAALRSARP